MQTWTFYSQHLTRVSRSFSFCIAQLKTPQREWIALSYLLFRIADTIEDSKWNNQHAQFLAFEHFKHALKTPKNDDNLQLWPTIFPLEIPDSEKQLLNDLSLLLNDYHELPISIKKQLLKNIDQMMSGMQYFLKHHSEKGELVLTSLPLLNQYCFFVAGLVGELLTVCFLEEIEDTKCNETLLINGFHFGLFLQKINILKDQLKDENLGRKFISSRKELRLSINQHANHALAYLKNLPVTQGKTFRVFCAWSLFIGLASLKWIDKSFNEKKTYKISKTETMALIFKIKGMIDSNASLEKLFIKYMPIPHNEKKLDERKSDINLPPWFREIYPSVQLNSYAKELGLVE